VCVCVLARVSPIGPGSLQSGFSTLIYVNVMCNVIYYIGVLGPLERRERSELRAA
jgi:hypothetical protein